MSLFELVNLEELQVTARVEESDVHQLSEGMPVEITGDGFTGLVLRGQIRSVGGKRHQYRNASWRSKLRSDGIGPWTRGRAAKATEAGHECKAGGCHLPP
ncbi:HlyD family secretion protein [Pseudomonas syringae]|nr:HlyD family secretion protein [Pseudomonas syringae]